MSDFTNVNQSGYFIGNHHHFDDVMPDYHFLSDLDLKKQLTKPAPKIVHFDENKEIIFALKSMDAKKGTVLQNAMIHESG